MTIDLARLVDSPGVKFPRIGFLGVGWIGRHRLQALAESETAEIIAIADSSAQCLASAHKLAPRAALGESLDDLLSIRLDGIVIATPSALHAEQCIAALNRGIAVFCQKPLARTAAEARLVVEAARSADRPLGVDLSYRFTSSLQQIRHLIRTQQLGHVFGADLTFHNAYGPDKPWFRNWALSGGGCVMDLGVHLVDLALWLLGYPEVRDVHSCLLSGGLPVQPGSAQVEDYATAEMSLSSGTQVRLACSWHLPAGRDAVIETAFYGTRGGAAMRNVNGSFFDFRAEHYQGTATTLLAEPPDDWGGRALVRWARDLATNARFDDDARHFVHTHEVLDAIYQRTTSI